jgi:hypothetical protein
MVHNEDFELPDRNARPNWEKMKDDVCDAIDRLVELWDDAAESDESYAKFVQEHFASTAGALAFFCSYVNSIDGIEPPAHTVN